MKFTRIIASLCVLVASLSLAMAQVIPVTSTRASQESFTAGRFIANQYAYSGTFSTSVYTGNAATGSASLTVRGGYITLHDGRSIVPFAVGVPLVISDAAPELITPTAVSGCYNSKGGNQDGILVTCTITAVFAATHGAGASVLSATGGLAEAANDAFSWGGGVVTIAPGFLLNTSCTGCFANIQTALAAILPYAAVSFEDTRSGFPQRITPQPNTTFLAVPATGTATTVGFGLNGANTTGGTYTGASTYHTCVAYVDIMGNEGPCSLDFSGLTAGTGTTNQIGFSAPAASAGAVGYLPYISLAGGTYALAYRAPLTASVCTLTKLETVIAACAVANATYGQSASAAIVSALTVNTARLAAQLGAASTTADIVSNSAAHTAYVYAPGGDGPALLPLSSYAPFTVTTAAATTVPAILGTVQLPAGFMNQVGRTIRICGHATQASAGSTATVETIQMVWDADGSNTTGAGVIIGNGLNLTSTVVTGNADIYNFCEVLRTTVSGAGVTAGSIQSVGGQLVVDGAQTSTSNRVGGDTSVAATGSLNLAGEARIDVQYVHTTGTDGAGVILQNLTVEVLN